MEEEWRPIADATAHCSWSQITDILMLLVSFLSSCAEQCRVRALPELPGRACPVSVSLPGHQTWQKLICRMLCGFSQAQEGILEVLFVLCALLLGHFQVGSKLSAVPLFNGSWSNAQNGGSLLYSLNFCSCKPAVLCKIRPRGTFCFHQWHESLGGRWEFPHPVAVSPWVE